MAAWLLYVTAVGGAFGLAALLAERGLRHLGRPVRWAWAGAMVGTVALPTVVMLAVDGGDTAPGAFGTPGVDNVLLLAWVAATIVLLANLRLSAWTLRRNERSWRADRLAGHRVLVSAGFGPAVVGTSRPRIVLPTWVLASAPSLGRLVVMHEAEHVRARDTRLLVGALILVALMPWCLPLWWQLHRLRGAIETDCDARVLARSAYPRPYANALVAIAGRRTRGLLPVPALAPRRAELERRIRLITARKGERSYRAASGLLLAAAMVVVGLVALEAPAPPRVHLDIGFSVEGAAPLEVPREAKVILSVTPE